VDARLPESAEDPTDEQLDARDAALDAARDALEAGGWTLAVEGGNALLAWRELPSDSAARAKALGGIETQAEEVLTRALEAAGPLAEVRVHAHAAPVEVEQDAQGRPRLAGGGLLRLERWTTGGAPGAVTLSEAFD
jgi:serine/threonine-protein kinase